MSAPGVGTNYTDARPPVTRTKTKGGKNTVVHAWKVGAYTDNNNRRRVVNDVFFSPDPVFAIGLAKFRY